MGIGQGKRNSSVELLRIITIMGVILLHYNLDSMGKAMSYVQHGSPNHYYLLFTQTLFMCAVDLTIIISAYYLSATQKRRFIKVVELFLQLIVFRLAFYIIAVLTGEQEFTAGQLLRNLIPRNYYVVLYCTLYIISPYINLAFNSLSRKGQKRMLLTLFLLFSVWTYCVDYLEQSFGSYATQLSTVGLYGSQSGYTIVNFVLLYVIGAYLRSTKAELSSKKGLAILLLYFSLLYAAVLIQNWSTGMINVWQYNSPFTIAFAVIVFLFFNGLKFYSPLINELAKAGFTCFLFHPIIVQHLHVEQAVSGNLAGLICHQLAAAVASFLVSYIVYKIYVPCADWVLKPIKPLFGRIELSAGDV